VLLVERQMPLGPLDPLAHHVDGPDELAALGGIVGQDQVQLELARAGLPEESAADFLRAVVPEARVEVGIAPADGAVALNVADQVRLARVGRQGGQADDQGHRRGAGPEGTRPAIDLWLFRGHGCGLRRDQEANGPSVSLTHPTRD
jgi:hypothetical protein